MHLIKLKEILKHHEESMLFPCVADLAENGIEVDRFASHERVPSRQDVTQFLAAWFRYINVAPEACQDWMVGYCTDVLAPISSSSKSQIRHSTKSNIKYVYGSAVELNCRCGDNVLKATCKATCPAYEEMLEKHRNAGSFSIDKVDTKEFEKDAEPALSCKEKYRDQFIEAIRIMRMHHANNVARKEIVRILNEAGFRTRTGKLWKLGTLAYELKNR